MGWRIRRALPEDAELWARCHRACWRETYAPIVDPALLEGELGVEEDWVRRAAERLSQPAGPRSWIALDDDDQVVGIATVGPARGDLAQVTDEQLYALFVRAAWHGTGLGQALLARALGTAAACLEVLEDNGRARSFYARHGFRPTGIRKKFERLDAWELVLARPALHTIRPAAEDDVAFLTDVVMEATTAQGRFPADLDEEEYRSGFAGWTLEQVQGDISDSQTSVIELDGRDVGRLRVVRTDGELELAGLQLLPAYQGRGVGGAILRGLMAEAKATGRRFVVSVEQDEPRARAFYESHGLRVVGETDRDLMMALP